MREGTHIFGEGFGLVEGGRIHLPVAGDGILAITTPKAQRNACSDTPSGVNVQATLNDTTCLDKPLENKRAEAGLVVSTPVDIMGTAAEAQAAKAAIITVFLANMFCGCD